MFKTRQSLKVMNALAICNCDLDLGPTRLLKCQLVPEIVIVNMTISGTSWHLSLVGPRSRYFV